MVYIISKLFLLFLNAQQITARYDRYPGSHTHCRKPKTIIDDLQQGHLDRGTPYLIPTNSNAPGEPVI